LEESVYPSYTDMNQ